MEKFYITTSIVYVNADPHVGHALEFTQADIIARYQRLLGKEIFFLTGTDEHGAKVARAAEAQGKDVKKFVDEISEKVKNLTEKLNISNDDFIRTSDKKRHWPASEALWKKLAAKGDIYKANYKGFYCLACEAFITKKDLIDGKCRWHDQELEEINEENYFFKLSAYQKEIEKIIVSGEFKIIPESRKNEVLGLIKQGLEDVSFSRSAKDVPWGIPVPGDSSQTMYVWTDALTNYISALGYGTKDDSKLKKYWPADVQVIGKDILRFHAIIWPAMLMSIGLELPKTLLVHGHIIFGGKKMSKSLGNIINPFDLINRYGTDAVRYYLSREILTTEDGDLTEEKFKEAYNANLANGLGNLVSRIMKMAEQYLDEPVNISDVRPMKDVNKPIEKFEFSRAMDSLWHYISELDGLIQEQKPFEVAKKDKKRARKQLTYLVKELARIAKHLKPFMPETSEKILEAIKVNKMPPPLFLRKE